MGLQLDIFFNTAICISLIAVIGYIISRILGRVDIVDSIWGLGFLVIAVVNSVSFDSLNTLSTIVLVLVAVWSVRLSTYLTYRNLQKEEDKRYVSMLNNWKGPRELNIILRIFLLQSVLIGIISYPISFVVRANPSFVTPWMFLGVCLFAIGFFFEVSADWELFNFKKSNRQSSVCRSGVWGLTRHPNYFGEILMIWSYFFFALSLPGGIFSIVSPILLSFLIVKVSGVAMKEDIMEEKGEEYKKYVNEVPTLFPMTKSSLFIFIKVTIAVVLLDMFWLGFLMNDFYLEQTQKVARLNESGFDTLYWAAAFVYFFIPIGVSFFAIKNSESRAYSTFKGAIFGLALYGVYDFTNLALVKNWPLEMSLVDLLWGSVICSTAAFVGHPSKKK